MRYFIVVGEASADLHASKLIEALRQMDAEATFAFMGGELMAEASGVEPIVHYKEVAFMGFLPVLRNFAKIRRSARVVQQAILDFRPDVLIPVDFAGFNLRYILPFVKKHLTCPIYYYIAPKLWAWQAGRIKALRKYVDLMLCILPFEEKYFSERGLPTLYVGNPCVDATLEARCTQDIKPTEQIALLPGSRQQELASNLPEMLRATVAYAERYRVVVAGAPGLTPEDYTEYLRHYPDVELCFGATYRMVQTSRVALVTSGTATLEVALLGTPQIVLYRMGGQRWIRWVFKHFFSTPYISLVNLILGREAVPELLGAEARWQEIRNHLVALLADTSARSLQLSSIEQLRKTLGQTSSSVLAAQAIIKHKTTQQI